MNKRDLLASDKFKDLKVPKEFNTCFYYESDDYYRVYDMDSDSFSDCETLPLKNTFLIQQPYECTDESLLLFANDYLYQILCLKEKKFRIGGLMGDRSFDLLRVRNDFYNSFSVAIFKVLMLSIKKCHKSMMRPLSLYELQYEEACFNAGYKTYVEGEYKGLYAYDFKMFYPHIMGHNSKFQIACNEGTLYNYDDWEIPENAKQVEYGFYEIDIKLKGKGLDILKWLPFMSKRNYVLTHYDLLIVFKLKQIYKLNDDELQMTKRNTKYIYDTADLAYGRDVFGKWFEIVKTIKDDPNTKSLGKVLASRGWGVLCQNNIKFVKDISKMNIVEDEIKTGYASLVEVVRYANGDIKHYSIIPKNKHIRKHPWRIKSFITAFGRYQIICILFNLIKDDCVKVVTDGFYLKSPLSNKILHDNPTLLFEGDKSNRPCSISKGKVIFS